MILIKNEPSSLATSSGSAMCSLLMCSTGAEEGGCLSEILCIRLHIAEKGEFEVKEETYLHQLMFFDMLIVF